MRMCSSTARGLTATIAIATAVVLLASNFTIINAQQSVTSQPSAIENGITTAATTFQSTNDSFSIQVPQGWVIQDLNNTGSALLNESSQGYGLLAQVCPEEEQQQQQGAVSLRNASGGSPNSNFSGSVNSCQGAQQVIHIIRYPNLETRTQPANNVTAYHLQKLQEVGYSRIQTVNSTATTVNITNPHTNETIATMPGKFVEMAYSTNSAPNETRNGYFILTATAATDPDVGTIKGYAVFYEGNTSSAATPGLTRTSATSSANLMSAPLSPTATQILHSFELIAAPEVVSPPPQPGGGTGSATTGGGDLN